VSRLLGPLTQSRRRGRGLWSKDGPGARAGYGCTRQPAALVPLSAAVLSSALCSAFTSLVVATSLALETSATWGMVRVAAELAHLMAMQCYGSKHLRAAQWKGYIWII
jgi:hypothetical protein